MVGFVRKIEDGREAAFRLANHRLQPLGYLTAARFLSINDIATYANAIVPRIVPEIVPDSSEERASKRRRKGTSTVTPECNGSFHQLTSPQVVDARGLPHKSWRPLHRAAARQDAQPPWKGALRVVWSTQRSIKPGAA